MMAGEQEGHAWRMGCWGTHGGWGAGSFIHDGEGGGETSWPFGFLQQLQLCDDREYRIGRGSLTATLSGIDIQHPIPTLKKISSILSQITFLDRSCNLIVNNPFKSPSLHTTHKSNPHQLSPASPRAAPLWANAMPSALVPPARTHA
ncbi:hypothetical protein VC83_07822 [Pseudogymnoascus destructans]|uniref:Uncharacterized protein n=1 Tax=Pseudogymnoascus destructans TaxID=655981 RepID=A0A177A0E5_9PEZI|nr:uncharacterized protein VC83_07822 [Pseudogymnoascus destructans]OAF55749.1 hypothetical protein VC83_07822 [Pseudogymnoascus destructans]